LSKAFPVFHKILSGGQKGEGGFQSLGTRKKLINSAAVQAHIPTPAAVAALDQ
jgi:hypothetical protein